MSHTTEDAYELRGILKPDKSVDIQAVVYLRQLRDRNSGMLSEKTFELKSKFADYVPHKLVRTTKSLEKAAGLDEPIETEDHHGEPSNCTHAVLYVKTENNVTCQLLRR